MLRSEFQNAARITATESRKAHADSARSAASASLEKQRPVDLAQPRRPGAGIGLGTSDSGRADTAFRLEWDKWQLLIDAALADQGLSPEQRNIAIAGLRFHQKIEAAAARARVAQEEAQKATATQRVARQASNDPPKLS